MKSFQYYNSIFQQPIEIRGNWISLSATAFHCYRVRQESTLNDICDNIIIKKLYAINKVIIKAKKSSTL